jgi:glycosyltransferase involved in cell wall biosynthesis
MKWTGRWWWRLLAPSSIRHATCIVASSEATRNQIKKHFVFPEEKIRVVYPCVREGLSRVADARSRLTQYNLPPKYILFVGILEPRKNLMNLVHAFVLAKRRAKLDHALVLAGERGWDFDRLAFTIEQSGFSKQIILPGHIADKDLSALYSAADLFTLVSWHEGFGLPIIEAMACGTPVIASNVSSLPEVLGDAGILVDPNQPEEIAAQIVRVLTDSDLAQEMVIRGESRARLFSTERFRQGILGVYRQAKLSSNGLKNHAHWN